MHLGLIGVAGGPAIDTICVDLAAPDPLDLAVLKPHNMTAFQTPKSVVPVALWVRSDTGGPGTCGRRLVGLPDACPAFDLAFEHDICSAKEGLTASSATEDECLVPLATAAEDQKFLAVSSLPPVRVDRTRVIAGIFSLDLKRVEEDRGKHDGDLSWKRAGRPRNPADRREMRNRTQVRSYAMRWP